MAEWLNTTFYGLDSGVFSAMNDLAKSMGGFFTPFSKVITLIGEKGLIFIFAAIILMLFSKTRKLGVCMIGALAIGAIITDLALKHIVERARPFESDEQFNAFWTFLGSPKVSGYSFPSGHATAITAAATALFIMCNKKWSWVGFLGVILMGFSRVYLIHHYFTDVSAGIIVGAVSGIIAYFITKLIFNLLEKHRDKKFCAFCIDFDVRNIFKKKSEK